MKHIQRNARKIKMHAGMGFDLCCGILHKGVPADFFIVTGIVYAEGAVIEDALIRKRNTGFRMPGTNIAIHLGHLFCRSFIRIGDMIGRREIIENLIDLKCGAPIGLIQRFQNACMIGMRMGD